VGESSPLLVLLLVSIVAGCSWLLGWRAARRRTPPLARDFGATAAERIGRDFSEDLEAQFELAALYRKRGELDRATGVHTRLRAAAPAVRDRAGFELARDFLAAGLMDRAEQLLRELAAVPDFRDRSLDLLVRLYEQQADWANALRVFEELPAQTRTARKSVAAHYLCELAEQALVQGDYARVAALLRQAASHDSGSSRVLEIRGRVAELQGDTAGALAALSQAINAAPRLVLELLPRMARIERSSGNAGYVERLTHEFQRSGRFSDTQVERSFSVAAQSATGARNCVHGPRYVCGECGFRSASWYWHCPSCRAWETLAPTLLLPEER
jgi:lipopolysaccharide biosynthesis regulator YciM